MAALATATVGLFLIARAIASSNVTRVAGIGACPATVAIGARQGSGHHGARQRNETHPKGFALSRFRGYRRIEST